MVKKRKPKTSRFALKFSRKGVEIEKIPKGRIITQKERKELLKKKSIFIERGRTGREAARKVSRRSFFQETGKRLR